MMNDRINAGEFDGSLPFKEFTFVSLINSPEQYDAHFGTLKEAGFRNGSTNYLYFDNTNENTYDPYKSYNHALSISNSDYVIFVHQDTRFVFDGIDDLRRCLRQLDDLDPNWAVAGNAGGNEDLDKKFIRISDPSNQNLKCGPFPQKVQTLDENFLLIKKSSNAAFSNDLSGFHFYGTDLCQQAFFRGYTSYVIDYHIKHLSSGTKDKTYYDAKSHFINSYKGKLGLRFIRATTGRMSLCGLKIGSIVFNNRHILFILRKTRLYKLLKRL